MTRGINTRYQSPKLDQQRAAAQEEKRWRKIQDRVKKRADAEEEAWWRSIEEFPTSLSVSGCYCDAASSEATWSYLEPIEKEEAEIG